MKIAYLFDTFPAVSETFLAREIAALRRGGCDIEVFALHAGENATPILPRALLLKERALRVLARDEKARQKSFERIGARFAATLHARDFDWIHAAFASHPATIGRIAAREMGLPFSFSGHARDLFLEGGDLKSKLRAARFAACCTSAGAKKLRAVAPSEAAKVLFLPHGLDLPRYRFIAFAPPPKTLEIFSVGRLIEKKGFAIWVDALAILRRQMPREYSLHATIIGDGPQRRALENRIARRGLNDCVSLTGAMSPIPTRRAMMAATARGALFVLPSQVAHDGDRDGLANVLLEAAACGMPLLTTRAAAAADTFGESGAAFFPAGDAAALAETILAARFDEEKSRMRCAVARAIVEENFDVEKNVEALRAAFFAAL